MSLPRCPDCHSDNVSPNRWHAGQNVCGSCGLAAPVARFHEERPLATPTRGRKWQPEPPRTYRAAPVKGRRHAQQPQVKQTEHFWWQDI
jgi:hypothetical protein